MKYKIKIASQEHALLGNAAKGGKQRMKLNPNKEIVEKIKYRIKENEGHCPCIAERNEDTLCPCKDMREKNICHCNLYIKS